MLKGISISLVGEGRQCMLQFIGENIVLILCSLSTVLGCMILIFGAGSLANAGGEGTISWKVFPFDFRRMMFGPRGIWRRIFLLSLVMLFAGAYWIGLQRLPIPVWAACLLVLPFTAVTVVAVELFLFFGSLLLRRWLHIEQKQFNLLYSFSLMQLFLLGIFLCISGQNLVDRRAFLLAVFNLLFCYLLAVIGLYLLLKEASAKDTTLTLRSVWKSALLQIILFLVILTFLSYFGFLHNPDSYQTPDGTFSLGAAFYHVTVTFGTVGYGDIIPLSGYTRAVSVLTVFASILSLTVMLSAVLSLSGQFLRNQQAPLSKEKMLDENLASDGNQQNSADQLSFLSEQVSKTLSDKDSNKTE